MPSLPFHNYDEPTMPYESDSSDNNNEHGDSKWNIFEKRACMFYI